MTPKKRRLEHEGGERLVSEQRSLDRPGPFGEHAPVGAELEGHDDPGDHAHAERHREDLEPEIEDAPVERIAGDEPHALDRRQPRRQPDREGRKDDVEADHEAELDARQEDRIEVHGSVPCHARDGAVRVPSMTILACTISVGNAAFEKPAATATFCAPFAV